MSWRNEFWPGDLFPSAVGMDEPAIKRYVEFQGEVGKGQLALQPDLGVRSPAHGRKPMGIYNEFHRFVS